jgi:hypothetical protein
MRSCAALHDVKQKTGFKHLLLEKRLAAAADEVERQTVTLSEVLAAARLDPLVLGKLEKQLADVVRTKDEAIKELEGELGRVVCDHTHTKNVIHRNYLCPLEVPTAGRRARPCGGDVFAQIGRVWYTQRRAWVPPHVRGRNYQRSCSQRKRSVPRRCSVKV